MVKTVAGQSETVRDDIEAIETVTEAHVVAGQYDVISEVEGEEVYDALHTASSVIQGMEGVADTKTYICLE